MRKLFLLLFGIVFFAAMAMAQRSITGKVTDDKGKPIPNASVLVKGTTTGTTTREDGSYTLVVPENGKTIVISSVGMVSQELPIGANTIVSASLVSEEKALDEVVVVAYGTQKKETLTGSVGQIKSGQIEKRPLNNITASIEGAIPGVVTTSANGQPGSSLAIRVRGFGSINATSEPLFVVDGVPYIGGTSNINPADVENISVLKDASSTALYGSRAANGVVLITTKKGRKGRNNISVRIMQGIASRGLPEYERVDATAYYPIMWEAYRNSLVYPSAGAAISFDSANRVASGLTTRTSIQGLLAYNPFNVANNAIVGTNGQLNPNASLKYEDDLDWTNDLLRNGKRSEYNVNFSGGADKSDYFMSLGYVREDGYTVKTDFKRYSARLNLNVQPKDWIKTGLNISGNHSISTTASDGGSTNFVNPFFFSRNIGPIYPVYAHNMTTGQYVVDNNNNRVWDLGNFGTSALGIANGIPNRPSGGFAGRHALAETVLNDPNFKRTVVSARNYVDIIFTKNLKFTNNISIDVQNQNNSTYENTLVGDGAPAGRLQKQSLSSTAFIASQLFNYSPKINGGHKFDILAGHESYNQLETDVNGFRQGQTVTGITELGNFSTINGVGSSSDRYKIESYLSRFNYDYKGKYFVSASLRTDGNSRFSKESRWGTFWSVGGGWNLDKEKVFDNVKWLNLLKLRSSYGVVGVADGIGFYAYQGLYNFANNANEPGIVQSQTQALLNRELTWEVNKQFDLGFDFAIFNNRISGSFEYYKRISADLLFAIPQPLSSGVLTATQNTATMYNKGVELQLSLDVIKTRNFTWNTSLNISTVENQITKMPDAVPEFITGTKKYAVGHSIFDYWLRSYYGVDPADGAALYVPVSNATASTLRSIPNKNGGVDIVTTSINNAKFDYQGGTIPNYYGSFTQSFTFGQITFSGLFTFQKGGKTYDALYQSLMAAGNLGGAVHKDILKRWQKPGDITNVPRVDIGAQRATDFNATSSRWLVDASFINIRSLSLSFNLPKTLLSRFKLSDADFFVSAENVAFFSKRTGINNQQAFSGVTSNAYPPARVISMGLTLNL